MEREQNANICILGKIPVLKLLIQLYLQEMTKMTKGKVRKRKVYPDLKKLYSRILPMNDGDEDLINYGYFQK